MTFPPFSWLTLRGRWLPFSVHLDRRVPLVIVALTLALLLALVLSVSYGEYQMAPADVLRAVLGLETTDSNDRLVVYNFRLPRILLSLLIGSALATSGAIMQGLTRNDLADPGLLGINSGAGVLVVGYLTYTAAPNPPVLPWLALLGGLAAAAVVYTLAGAGDSSSARLLLIGVGVASLGGALIGYFLTKLTLDNAQQAYIWLTGSVYASTWPEVRLLFFWLVALLPLTFLFARPLNLLNLGPEVAVSLGSRLELYRLLLIILSSALAAVTVTVAGTIGFVGFIAPHIGRRLVGPAHEGLLLTTALVGGLLLVVADLASRWVIAPSSLPLGVTTAVIGAPYFAYLLYKRG